MFYEHVHVAAELPPALAQRRTLDHSPARTLPGTLLWKAVVRVADEDDVDFVDFMAA